MELEQVMHGLTHGSHLSSCIYELSGQDRVQLFSTGSYVTLLEQARHSSGCPSLFDGAKGVIHVHYPPLGEELRASQV